MEAAMTTDFKTSDAPSPASKYPVDPQGFITSLQGVEVGDLFLCIDMQTHFDGRFLCTETTPDHCRIGLNIYRIADAGLIPNPRPTSWPRPRLKPPPSEMLIASVEKLRPMPMPSIEATLADYSRKVTSDTEVDAMTTKQLAAEIDHRLKAIDADQSSSNDIGLDKPKAFHAARKIQIQRRHYDDHDIFVFADKADAVSYVKWLRDGHIGLPHQAGIGDATREEDE